MTAIPSIAYPAMDLLHPDDTMDLASSPRMPEDDFPLDLDTMRDASVDPMQEPMLEDPTPSQQHSAEDVQLDDEEILHDDDMLDEDTVIPDPEANAEDLTMEVHQQTHPDGVIEDDDILYDDEEGVQDEKTQDQDQHELDIDDEEDLFREDEAVQELEMEETAGEPHDEFEEHVEVVSFAEQITNTTTQEPHDPEAIQNSGSTPNENNNTDDSFPEHLAHDEYKLQHENDHKEHIDTLSDGEHSTTGAATATVVEVQEPSNLPEQESSGQLTEPPAALTEVASQDGASQSLNHEEPGLQHGSTKAALHAKQEDEGRHLDHPASLHTVKVNYQDNQICLFPPTEDDGSDMFFLSDVSLAHQGLDKLLSACRDVLAGTIEEDDELVLDIPSLGLHISEDSCYAAQITLSQILEVYLMLCHNDLEAELEPLHCNLSSRVSLAAQHAYLLSVAQHGKTFTEIAAEHVGSSAGSPEHSGETGEFVLDPLGEGEDYTQADHDQTIQDQDQGDQGSTSREQPDPKPSEELEHHQKEDNQEHYHQEQEQEENIFPKDDSHAESDPVTGLNGDDEVAELADHQESKTSATSTVRGDETEPQDLNEAPDHFVESLSHSYSVSDKLNQYGETFGTHDPLANISDEKVKTPNVKADTESSHTIEAGDDVLDRNENANEEAEHYSLADDPESAPHDAEADYFAEEQDDTTLLDSTTLRHTEDLEGPTQSAENDILVFEDELHHELGGHHEDDDPSGHASANRASAEHEDIFGDSEPKGNTTSEKSLDGGVLDAFDAKTEASFHEVTPPTTPSGKSSKRKAMGDDDGFDLLDFETPDSKRRRPS